MTRQTTKQLKQMIKGMIKEISYQNEYREYNELLPVVLELLATSPEPYVADALEMLANEVRDGVHS